MNIGTHFISDKHLANIGTCTKIGTQVICALSTRPERRIQLQDSRLGSYELNRLPVDKPPGPQHAEVIAAGQL